MDEDVYEVLPVDPIQKLEREINELRRIIKFKEKEEEKYLTGITKEIVELIKVTQQIVSSFIKSNTELQSKISDLTSKIDVLSDEVRNLVEILREAAVEAKEEEQKPINVQVDLTELESKFDELKQSNEELKNILKEIKELLRSGRKTVLPPPPLPPKPFIPRR